MGVASGCGEQEVGVASGSGWNLWVWLLGVVVRSYIDFLILLIPSCICSFLQHNISNPQITKHCYLIEMYVCMIHPHTPTHPHTYTPTHTHTYIHTYKKKQSVPLPLSGHAIRHGRNARALSGPMSQCNATSWSRARNSQVD